jgi:hypothetical protein
MTQYKQPANRHPRSGLERLLKRKAKALVVAERKYWETFTSLRRQRDQTASSLSLPYDDALPKDISSTVWALTDGVAFVRYKSVGQTPQVDFRVLSISLDEWGKSGLIVPLPQGDLSIAGTRAVCGIANLLFVNCTFNGIVVPYAEFAHVKYGDPANAPSVEAAVLDFQLSLMGLQARDYAAMPQRLTGPDTIAALGALAGEFESLLDAETREEDLQRFLKAHPFILDPSAEAIPKQKLGEDFITDFVLVATTTQGPTYIMVELERASHPILTKDLTLSSPASHAIKQTRDWDVWLEKNKSYLQNRLPGFETPAFLVVIGRAKNMTEDEKAYLRSYNREWKNTQLLSYDDVLHRFRATLANLHTAYPPSPPRTGNDGAASA